VVDGRDEAEMVESAMESLRARLPGHSDADLRAIVDEELTRVHLRALLARQPEGWPEPADGSGCEDGDQGLGIGS